MAGIRTHLQDVRQLLDPLTLWNWDLFFPRLPVGGDSRELTVKIQTSEIPEITIEKVTTELKGVKVHYKSKRVYEGTLESNVIETRDMGTRAIFADWAKLMHDPQNNAGSYKSEYAIDGVQGMLYDEKPNVIRRFIYSGFFPTSVGKVTVNSEAGGVVFPVTWSYDLYDESAV